MFIRADWGGKLFDPFRVVVYRVRCCYNMRLLRSRGEIIPQTKAGSCEWCIWWITIAHDINAIKFEKG